MLPQLAFREPLPDLANFLNILFPRLADHKMGGNNEPPSVKGSRRPGGSLFSLIFLSSHVFH